MIQKMNNLIHTGTCTCPDGIEREWGIFLIPPGHWYARPYRLAVVGDGYYQCWHFVFKEEPLKFIKEWSKAIKLVDTAQENMID